MHNSCYCSGLLEPFGKSAAQTAGTFDKGGRRASALPYSCLCILLAVFSLGVMPFDSRAAEIRRVDEVPGGGFVGDLWTFRCPAGGSVDVRVDTFPDVALNGGVFSALDPVLEIYDGRGNLLALGDDEVLCSAALFCDAACPAVTFACGQGVRHSIVIRDAGALPDCFGGGSYELVVEAFGAGGGSRLQSSVQLGGGPFQELPQWLVNTGVTGRRGPVVDDGPVSAILLGASTSATVAASAKVTAKRTQ